MRLEEIDKNFCLTPVDAPDVVWHDAKEKPFSLHGVYYSEEEGLYRRIPKEVAAKASEGVSNLATNTAGGRLRFATDSPYIAIKCVTRGKQAKPHLTFACSYGFSIYKNGAFYNIIVPSFTDIPKEFDVPMAFAGMRPLDREMGEITVYFPLYGDVCEVYIGLAEGAIIDPPKPYTHELPVVFYGSSITQGGCATRPASEYVGLLSQMLDTEYLNLGFGGSAKGEGAMAEYIASLDASVFVLDYDHNAPSVEFLKRTHLPFFRTLREKHRTTPIILISKPDFENDPDAARRRDVIRETYHRARSEGDRNVYFIDGESLFGKEHRAACTVDRIHPNDLGFFRMAQTVYPVLDRLLNK